MRNPEKLYFGSSTRKNNNQDTLPFFPHGLRHFLITPNLNNSSMHTQRVQMGIEMAIKSLADAFARVLRP